MIDTPGTGQDVSGASNCWPGLLGGVRGPVERLPAMGARCQLALLDGSRDNRRASGPVGSAHAQNHLPSRGARRRRPGASRPGRPAPQDRGRATDTVMRAATIVDGRVEVRDHPDPVPGWGQLLVRVRAAGLNGADLIQVAGHYPAPAGSPPDIPGLELAGEVASVGPGVTRFEPGDSVMAVVGGGGQAELAVIGEREAMPVPAGISWEEAGGFPEVFTTAHDALCSQACLSTGERLLVNGAAGGVGTAGVQIGLVCGATVTASVRSPQRRADVAGLSGPGPGTLVVVDPDEVADRGPYDVILELVGAPNLPGDLAALATGGRIAVIGTGAGNRAEIDLGLLMRARGRIHGSTLRARPPEAKATAARAVEAHVLPHLAAGRLRVPVCGTFPLVDAAGAYERFAAGTKFGKVVLVSG